MDGNYEAIQAKAIQKKGHHVINISIKWKSLLHLFKKNKITYRKVDNIDVYEYVGILPVLPFIFKNYNFILWMKKRILYKVYLKVVANHGKPDLVHSHSLFVSEYAVVLKEKFFIPIIFTEHWSKINLDIIDKNLYRKSKVYNKADYIITVSNALCENLQKHFNVKSQVIYNMVEDSFFRTKETVSKEKFTFISVGRLIKEKGFDVLIHAFKRAQLESNVLLEIIGDGVEYEKLQRLIDSMELADRVKLHGMKTSIEVNKMLGNSDSFVLASHAETFGIVYIEAMAKGLPIIATRCGGPEEFINKENGILVSLNDIEELSKALVFMYNKRNSFNHNLIQKYCYDNFSQEVISGKILDIYNNVLHRTIECE